MNRVRTPSNSCGLVFILGHPLEHSLSPVMQNAAFAQLKLPLVYAPMDVPRNRLRIAIELMKNRYVLGSNVTIPYKETVLPYLDEVEPYAGWLGSVNTIYKRDGKIFGTSTDGEGFLKSLGAWRRRLKGSRGLLVGAGGAAKAVAGALAMSGVKGLWITNRSHARAEKLKHALKGRFRNVSVQIVSLKETNELLNKCEWVVQATSVGLKKSDGSPVSLRRARPGTWVIDLIYHRETAFLKEARAQHLPCLGGIGMLLHQGALSFKFWTGREAPLGAMKRALIPRLAFR